MSDQTVNSGKDQTENKPEDSIPEVEAEIVEDHAPPSDFIETLDASEADAPEERRTEAPTKSHKLTPGLILFIAFAALAISALGYWLWHGRSGAEAAVGAVGDDHTAVEAQAGETAAMPLQDDATPVVALLPEGAAQGAAEGGVQGVSQEHAHPDPELETGSERSPASGPEPGRGPESQPFAAPTLVDAPTDELVRAEAPADDGVEDIPNAQPADADADATPALADADVKAVDAETVAQTETPDAAGISDAPVIASDDAPTASQGANPQFANSQAVQALQSAELRGLEAALALEAEKAAALEAEMLAMRARYEEALRARDEETAQRMASLRTQLDLLRTENEGLRADIAARAGTGSSAAGDALAALMGAIGKGDPYEPELAAVAQFSSDTPALTALRARAETGIATREELADSFGVAARKALAAAGQAGAGDGMAALMARAKSLVSVRPAYPQSGDGPAAVISRMEDAVGRGAFDAALVQIDILPPAAQGEFAGWAIAAQAHVDVTTALSALNGALLAQASR